MNEDTTDLSKVDLEFKATPVSARAAKGKMRYQGWIQHNLSLDRAEFVAIVPNNIFSPFLDGSVLSVLFLGILFGIVLAALKDKVPSFIKLLDEINKIFLKIVEVVIWFLPLAIICNVAKLIIGIPVESLYSVFDWILEMLIVTIVAFVLYGIGIALYVHVNPVHFFKKSISAWVTANASRKCECHRNRNCR